MCGTRVICRVIALEHLGREGWARNISEGDFVRDSNDSKGDDTVTDTITSSLQPSKSMTETGTVEAQGTVTKDHGSSSSSSSSSSFQESVAGQQNSNERATQDASAGTSLPQHTSTAGDSESRDGRDRGSRTTSTEAGTLTQTAGRDDDSELDPGKGLMKIMYDYQEMQPKGRIERKAAEEQEAAGLDAAASLQARALQSCEASISVYHVRVYRNSRSARLLYTAMG